MAQALLALMEERDGLVTGRPGRLRDRVAAGRGVLRRRPRSGSRGLARSSTRLRLPRSATPIRPTALALARVLAAPPYSGRTYEHTTNLWSSTGRERLRPHDEPRARLRRLPPRLRRPPQQHAGRVRPAHRPARARRTDGEHDVADDRARRDGLLVAAGAAGGTRLRPAPSRRSCRGSWTRVPSAGGGRPAAPALDGARSSTWSRGSRKGRSTRARDEATTCACGASSTTISAASARWLGRVRRLIRGGAGRL